jgi:hypothetical protein
MELTIAGDVVIDLATKGDLAEHHEKMRKLLEKPAGVYYTVQGSGTTGATPGSGPIAIVFDPPGPGNGRLWLVQWAAVWVATSPAAVAVVNLNAALMVGRAPLGPGGQLGATFTPNNSDPVAPGQPVPAAISVPDKTVVKRQWQLYMLLAGAGLVANTTYNMSAGVVDLPATAEALLW